MPTHPGHPAIASTTLVSASRSLLNDAFDSVSLQTVTATATLNPDDGRYVLVAPASHTTITLPDPASDERYQNVRLVLKRTTAGVYTATVVVAGGGLIDGSSSTTLNAQYDCEVLFSDGMAWHRLRDQTNLLAPDYLDFGDWIVGTDDSNPAPVATSDAYTAPDGTTTADELEWDNTTELADESWAEPGASVLEAGDGAEYSFYIDSEVGDGIKTVLEVEDTSVPGLLEQTTVAFSNVFAENHLIGTYGFESFVGTAPTATAASAPDGTSTAYTYECDGLSLANGRHTFYALRGEATISHYFLAESDVRRLRIYLSNVGASNTVYVDFNISVAAGIQVVSFSGSSSGLAYTASNALRYTQIPGTDWWRLDVRIAEYDGSYPVLTSDVWFYDSLNTQTSFTYWKADLRYGDHVSSQQLLTVDDGVENILNSVGIFDAADFDDLPNNVGSEAISAIAAPDGTLTAIETVSTSPTVQHNVSVLAFETTGTYTQIGSLWKDGVAWTGSVYVYMGQPNAARMSVVLQIRDTAGVVQDSVSVVIIDGSVNSVSTISSGSVAYSAERNVDLSPVGSSGWYRCSITIQDHTVTCDRIYFYLYGTSGSSYDRFITWSPALRYGDWVARGKNWNPLPDIADWSHTATDVALSSTPAPDGTLTAWDVNNSTTGTVGVAFPTYATIPITGGSWTLQIYVDHSDAQWDARAILTFRLRNSSIGFQERVNLFINEAGGAASLVVEQTQGPGYSLADIVSAEAIGSSGWWRYRVTLTDYAANADRLELAWVVQDLGSDARSRIWNPRLTVGNPADARGYFVSGPQNLLGDGSDYDPATSNWTVTGSSLPTVATNTAVAPNGRLEADTISLPAGAYAGLHRYAWAYSGMSGTAGASLTYRFYIKSDSSSPEPNFLFNYFLYDTAYAIIEQIGFRLDLNDVTIGYFVSGTTGGPGYTSDDVSITAISNDWFLVELTLIDYSGTGRGSGYIQHYSLDPSNAHDITLWGSELTTLDRTPTANELRPVSNGVVDFDAYPPEHRSLFADLEDAGDNWYKVTTKITDI